MHMHSLPLTTQKHSVWARFGKRIPSGKAEGRVRMAFSLPTSLVSPHRGGGLGGLTQGWEDSEGTVCSELGASYIFCFINQ